MRNDIITAAAFDWDLTLAQIMENQPFSVKLATLFQSKGFQYSADDIEQAIQTRQLLIRKGKLKGKLEIQTRRDIAFSYKQILEILGEDYVKLRFAFELYSDFANLPTTLYEESRSTLIELLNQGFKLGVITNNSTSARKVIEKNVGDLVHSNCIIISEEMGIHKPSKKLFLTMAARFRTHPQKCIYVGDNLNIDANAAVKNGGYKFGVWLDRQNIGSKSILPKNIIRIKSLHDVVSLVVK